MSGGNVFYDFMDALDNEISFREPLPSPVNTLYIGGGTPSVLPDGIFDSILDSLERNGYGRSFSEFTVEVNPDDIVNRGEGFAEHLLKLGVTRISMGIQSFDDGILKWMNRRHNAGQAVSAYSILRKAGFGNISVDLIFGLSQLGNDLWRRTIDRALDIEGNGIPPEHISAYQLSVEPGSALADMVANGKYDEASDDICSEQYSILQEKLHSAGFVHYEISNFARPGFEAVHNGAYWRDISYMGFGPGAHSYDSVSHRRFWTDPDLSSYIDRKFLSGEIVGQESLSPEQIVLEKIMLSLRTASGIDAAYLKDHSDSNVVERMIADGTLVYSNDNRLRISEENMFVSDSVISSLV